MMKKIVVRAAQALAALAVALGVAALSIHLGGLPSFTPQEPPVKAEPTPEQLSRGRKLVGLLCQDCHENTRTHQLTGKPMSDLPKAFGEIYSKNITNHPTRGIGQWSDGQLVYFLRTGVRPDGQYVPPWMAKFPHLSDADLLAVVAFLRSGAPLVAASDALPPGVTRPSLLSKVLARTVFRPLPYPAQPVEAPPKADRVAYGRYLTFALDCYSCHSADFKTMNVLEPEKTPGFLGGGNLLVDGAGAEIFSANLTPDDETGIGRWTEAQFVRAVTTGVRPDGRVLRYPMLPKTGLEVEEVGAIYAYLRTVPKLHHEVKRPAAPGAVAAAQDRSGAALFEIYGCVSCHGTSGVGPVGDLRSANEHYPSDRDLRTWIDEAPSLKPGTRMPAWKGLIREEDYAPLLEHVRALARPEEQARR
jgi:mono/diheme cytochrome c family protein